MDLEQLVRRQHGIVLRSQAIEFGISPRAIEHRLSCGRWQSVLRGLYATFSGPLAALHRLSAASLFAGLGAQITGTAALVIYQFRYAPSGDEIDVNVPLSNSRRSCGFVRIARTARPDRRWRRRSGLVISSPARAVADAARSATDLRTVRAFVAEAIQRQRCTVEDLNSELVSGPMRGSALFRRALCEVIDGTRSAPEAELRLILDGIPVKWNQRLIDGSGTKLPTPDGWISRSGIALEVDSREYHLGPEEWERTLVRHNILARHGILVLHFTPSQIRRDPRGVRSTVEAADRARRGSFAGVVVEFTPQ